MPRTRNYGWPKLEIGDTNYAQSHSALVDNIDGELARVEQGVSSDTTTVRTLEELYDAFGGLSAGETVVITDENAPYRTDRYLDIDASGVTAIGRGTFPLIKPANGANVGGLRVGHNTHVEDIHIDGFSFHGNPSGQTASQGGYGISADDVHGLRIENSHFERTWPWREHNQENSGIILRDKVQGYWLVNNRFFEIGDRAMTTQGRHGRILGNYSEQGFDRMVSVAGAERFGYNGTPNGTIIAGNELNVNQEGSMIGFDAVGDTDGTLITGNMAYGDHRTLVTLQGGFGGSKPRVSIIGNIGLNDGQPIEGSTNHFPGIRATNDDTLVANNWLNGYAGPGVRVADDERGPMDNIVVQNNRIMNCLEEGIAVFSTANDCVVQNNTLKNNVQASTSKHEIQNAGTGTLITGNTILSTPGAGAYRAAGAESSADYIGNVSYVGASTGGEFNAQSTVRDNHPAALVDVRATTPERGTVSYHDPSQSGDTNTEGPAFYDGSGWTSLVDGTTISALYNR